MNEQNEIYIELIIKRISWIFNINNGVWIVPNKNPLSFANFSVTSISACVLLVFFFFLFILLFSQLLSSCLWIFISRARESATYYGSSFSICAFVYSENVAWKLIIKIERIIYTFTVCVVLSRIIIIFFSSFYYRNAGLLALHVYLSKNCHCITHTLYVCVRICSLCVHILK